MGKDAVLQCSFCGKAQDAVAKLISSPKERPGTYICDECVVVCNDILDDDVKKPLAVIQDSTWVVLPRWFWGVCVAAGLLLWWLIR